MRKILPLFLFLLPVFAFASHIVGGTIMYTYLGGSSYEITVRLYRDCSGSNPAFPASIGVEVRDSAGNNFSPSKSFSVALDSTSPVPSYLPSCVANPNLCYEEGFYTTVRSDLPQQPGGYHIYYQYCCRQPSLNNISNPLTAGTSLYTFIPDQAIAGANSSPRWNLRPPLFECQGNPMNYDYGATDTDGDSLVFSYYTPYSDPAPTFPSNIATFTPVTWLGGYGANNPCGGANLTMLQTGFITGVPQNIGMYAAGVRCEEYRNGVKIAGIIRDYPFVVVTCPPAPTALFFAPTISCFGNTIQFQNNSIAATTYHWDFGDPNINGDTSNVQNPSWLYANPGTYTVTLVANPYTNCADTVTSVITVQQVHAAFTVNDTLYSGSVSQFTDSSWTSNGSPVVMWSWDFGDGGTSTQQNPMYTYTSDSTYNVTLIVLSVDGCLDTTMFTVVVLPPNGIAENAEAFIHLAPNPSGGTFTAFLPGEKTASIRVTDMTGRIVYEENCGGKKSAVIHLDVAPGVYFFEYRSEEKCGIERIVVR